jgi:hypothetical protein
MARGCAGAPWRGLGHERCAKLMHKCSRRSGSSEDGAEERLRSTGNCDNGHAPASRKTMRTSWRQKNGGSDPNTRRRGSAFESSGASELTGIVPWIGGERGAEGGIEEVADNKGLPLRKPPEACPCLGLCPPLHPGAEIANLNKEDANKSNPGKTNKRTPSTSIGKFNNKQNNFRKLIRIHRMRMKWGAEQMRSHGPRGLKRSNSYGVCYINENLNTEIFPQFKLALRGPYWIGN